MVFAVCSFLFFNKYQRMVKDTQSRILYLFFYKDFRIDSNSVIFQKYLCFDNFLALKIPPDVYILHQEGSFFYCPFFTNLFKVLLL